MACVDIPALPLQLVLRREPEWQSEPVVVVDRDHPQGRIEFANERAIRSGIVPGLTYSAGLALHRDLRATVVTRSEIGEEVTPLGSLLRHFSPNVEEAEDEAGVFWVDASGLDRLEVSLEQWGRRILRALDTRELVGSVAVGRTRFGTYAAARARSGVVRVFEDADDEHAATRVAPLVRLGISGKVSLSLDRLGLRTVGDLIALPPDGLRRRYGSELWRLREWAAGAREMPLSTARPDDPLRDVRDLDEGVDRIDAIVQIAEELSGPLMSALVSKGCGLSSLELTLSFERSPKCSELIRAAAPTLDLSRMLGLVFLRLEGLRLPEAVVEVEVELRGTRLSAEQYGLFDDTPRRDLRAGDRALARLRARFGEGSVRTAVLGDGHLPESRIGWEPFEGLTEPRARAVRVPPLVRRIYSPPVPLASRTRHEPDGWILNGPESGSVARTHGPYVIAGGWWGGDVHRDYYFAETRNGGIYWIYYDRKRRRWFLHGRIA